MNLANGVVVIDDHPRRREVACSILAAARVTVLGASASGFAASDILRIERPQFVFVAFEEPYQRSAQTLAFVAEAMPAAHVVAYASSEALTVFQQAVRAGAKAVLPAPFQESDVARVIEALAPGRSTIDPAREGGRIVAVVGQKGGIGKTTISVNLATALARERQAAVLIVDFDTSFGDVALGLNLDPTTTTARMARTYRDMDRDEFRSEMIRHESGAFVLPAPARMGEWLSVRPTDLQDMVKYAAEMFDYVLVDTPGAYDDAVAAGIEIADHALIVSSLELTSAKNTSLLLAALRSEGYADERTLIVANHTVFDTGFAPVQLAHMLQRGSIWEVPFDPLMRRSTQNGTPLAALSPNAPASVSLRALAGRLTAEPDNIERRRSMRDSRIRREAPPRRFGFGRRKAS